MPCRSMNKLLKSRTLKIKLLTSEVVNVKAYKYLCPVS